MMSQKRPPTVLEICGYALMAFAAIFGWSAFGPDALDFVINVFDYLIFWTNDSDYLDVVNDNSELIGPLLLTLILFRFGYFLLRGPKRTKIRPISPMIVALALIVIGITTWIFTRWLLSIADAGGTLDTAASAAVRIDAIRTGLGAGAGAGGLVALLLAARRQWTSEVSSVEAMSDATERRVTEQYAKALEQVGSAEVAIRLGGLYSLERLGQDNPSHRQRVVNMLCAYLRSSSGGTAAPADNPLRSAGVKARRQAKLKREEERTTRSDAGESIAVAQQIISTHLRYSWREEKVEEPNCVYWRGLSIDFSGVVLRDADFTGIAAEAANFERATFRGETKFRDAYFSDVSFARAKFEGAVDFRRAHFRRSVSFMRSVFQGEALFQHAHFRKHADFRNIRCESSCSFDGTRFIPLPPGLGTVVVAWLEWLAYLGLASRALIFPADVVGTRNDYRLARVVFDGTSFRADVSFALVKVLGYASFHNLKFFDAIDFGSFSYWGRATDFAGSIIAQTKLDESFFPRGWKASSSGSKDERGLVTFSYSGGAGILS